MPEAPADARIDRIPPDQIAALAKLYDRFAHALDPFSAEAAEAERAFMQEVAQSYDNLDPPKPSFQQFRKGVIVRCRKHLMATAKIPSV